MKNDKRPMTVWPFLKKYRKHINFWQLLVIRGLYPFALGGVFLAAVVLYQFVCSVLFDAAISWQMIPIALFLGIPGAFGVYYANRVADDVVARAEAEENYQAVVPDDFR